MFDESFLAARLALLIPLWLSLSVHEWAHAFSAQALGDDTARLQGRMTLNPIAHLDPVGTLLLPILGVPFGWAKPVPVEPLRFRGSVSMRLGIVITAAAGPLANLLLAALCFGLLSCGTEAAPLREPSPLAHLLRIGLYLNLVLALFNLLPVPPLDGGRVADGLMPERLRGIWDRFAALGPFALVAALLLLAAVGAGIRLPALS